jgi:signal transduction histidine kinase/CheY-like chemotaxis protein
MESTTRTTIFRYAGALVFTALAVQLRGLLDPWLSDSQPLSTLYGAVALTVWFGGYRPALLAVVLGYLTCDWLLIQPRGAFGFDSARDLIGLCLYLLSCGIIIGFGEALRRARTRARAGEIKAQGAEEESSRLNRELQHRADELQIILDILPIGVAIAHDPQCRRITHNPYMSELLNVLAWTNASLTAPENERPTTFTNYRNGKEVPTSELPMQIASTGVEVRDLELDLIVQCRDPRTMLYHARPLFDEQGQVRGSVGVCLDITERKRAEEGLRRQDERTRLLSKAAALLLHATDPDIALQKLFGKIASHFGLDSYFNYMVDETGNALRLHSYAGVPQETAQTINRLEFGEAISGTVALHRQPIVATYIQQSEDRKTQLAKSFGIRVYACIPLQVNEDLLGTLSFASRSRDELEEDELTILRTICHYVAVAYERMRLIGRLQDADRRKDEFLATLAHELRNPLAPIRNAVQILQMKGLAQPELQNSRDIIDRQVRQMTRLVNDLLDVSRISRGKIDLQKQQVLLSPILINAVEASRPLIEATKHELTLNLLPEPVCVEADTARLAQVFSNLLNNAAKFTEQGGHIWLAAQRQGSDVVVTVKDNGTGIPSDKLPALFEMFSQVEGSMGRSQGGLGIGLHLVKQLVEMHGGSVTARSEGPGKGSEFVVRLPIIIDAAGASHPIKEEGAVPKSSLRILIVDDNRDSADSLAMMLRIMGNDIHTAYDGEEAVAAAGEFRPDVVVLDIGLPKLNGYEACRRIRQQPWSKGVVLIAMTGWGQEEDRRRSQEAGFDKHMVKPVDPQVLMNVLGELDRVKA